MMEIVMETPRLILRRLALEDVDGLRAVHQDPEVMAAWEHAFSDEELLAWVEGCMARYERDGYCYNAVLRKEDGAVLGVAGLLREHALGRDFLGIGYILAKAHWHKGYALECARACADCARDNLGAAELTAQIRPENISSRRVAERLGMRVQGEFVKEYRGREMPHLIYGMAL